MKESEIGSKFLIENSAKASRTRRQEKLDRNVLART